MGRVQAIAPPPETHVALCNVRRVLLFDVVRPLGAGPVAQWESVRFTRGRSLVRSQPGPPAFTGSDMVFESQIRRRAEYVPNEHRVIA